jgi:hypothetical protein
VGSVGRPLVPDYRPDRFGKSLICSQIEKNRIAGSRGGRHWQGGKRKRPTWKTTPAALRGILGATASTGFGPMLGMYFVSYSASRYSYSYSYSNSTFSNAAYRSVVTAKSYSEPARSTIGIDEVQTAIEYEYRFTEYRFAEYRFTEYE